VIGPILISSLDFFFAATCLSSSRSGDGTIVGMSSSKMIRINVIQRIFRPKLSRRAVAVAINSTGYDLDDAISHEQQANPSHGEELLGRF
jgi:hypothetical protein